MLWIIIWTRFSIFFRLDLKDPFKIQAQVWSVMCSASIYGPSSNDFCCFHLNPLESSTARISHLSLFPKTPPSGSTKLSVSPPLSHPEPVNATENCRFSLYPSIRNRDKRPPSDVPSSWQCLAQYGAFPHRGGETRESSYANGEHFQGEFQDFHDRGKLDFSILGSTR